MKYITSIFLILAILSSACPVSADSAVPVIPPAQQDFRGLWVASVVNIDYPSKPTEDSEILKAEAIKILDYAKNTGFNAVFLQVRPTADALYKSSIFPWSKYLTGTQGLAPGNDFDPLAYWVEEAHNRGIQLHAWINPYRITKKAAGEPNHYLSSLAAGNPALLNPGWVVPHSDGNLYFNPGLPEVRQLIVSGVLEIVQNYAVDGIHFDDYFYPDKTFNDKAAYELYKSGAVSLDDWRRENVNTLIRSVSNAIKSTGRNVRFGISPFGIWANKTTHPLGSDTKGLESYVSHYADSLSWVKEGVIDYIAPQIYWPMGYSAADYTRLVNWWKNAVAGTDVDLYIGQAAYKAGSSDPASSWYGTAEIERQLRLNSQIPEVKGSIFYNYRSLAQNPALTAVIKAIYEQRDGKAAIIPVSIGRPSENIRTGFAKYYLGGASDPNKPLFINGQPVQNRSAQGYYGILLDLAPGANFFTLSQEGSYSAVAIYRDTAAAGTAKMTKAEIPSKSTFPQSQEYRMPGEKITLSCQAPIGSKVTVTLNGKTYSMNPSTAKSPGTGLYAATFTYVYTIPSFRGAPRNIDLGTPSYTMNYKGIKKTQKAPAKVGVIMKGSPFYAEVTGAVADTYNAPVAGNGAAYELYKGMVDSVTGMTGNYARLSSGQWILKSNVKITSAKTPKQPAIRKLEYLAGDKLDTLKLDLSSPAAGFASFDGTKLALTVSASAKGSLPKLPDGALFSSIAVSGTGSGIRYTLTIKQGQSLEGYYIEKTAAGLELKLKRKVVPIGGDENLLAGITIMLDPGHGGSEPGAIGPLGTKYAEKDINLNLALKLQKQLEALGAEVLMTRTTDAAVSLPARLAASRNARPDLFISLHANSMEDNVDISKISGFSVWYREALALKASQAIYDQTIGTLNRNRHGVNNRNFYVTRGTWAPSLLIESGFVPNPDEFEWLIGEAQQTKLASTIAEAVVKYFWSR